MYRYSPSWRSFRFFFFKHKPAYEVRISAWSSDVCSSDLEGEPRLQPARCARRHLGHRAPGLHRPRARPGQGLLRGLGGDADWGGDADRRRDGSGALMAELLVELFSEEIPARMQARAAEDLKRLVSDALKAANLSFDSARAFTTPRRLALVVAGLPAQQPAVVEEKKGPKEGAPAQEIGRAHV